MLVLISYTGGQGELYCSHETLYLSVLNPTVYIELFGNVDIMNCNIVLP